MYACPALQVLAVRGQHCCDATVVPSLHVWAVQSCTAPKVWPVSCLPMVLVYSSTRSGNITYAITCHSVEVNATTLVPLAVSVVPSVPLLVDEPRTHAWPNHARPTSEPVGQLVISVQCELESTKPPLHAENRLRRFCMLTLSLQA